MYGCESWTTKAAEHWRTDAFEQWCWKRLFLIVPWPARKSNQSILKETGPEYSLEGLILKLKLQYFGHWFEELTHWKRPWCLEIFEGRRRGGWLRMRCWMASATQWTCIWASSGRWWRIVKPGVPHAVHGVAKSWTWLSNWTTTALNVSLQPPRLLVYGIFPAILEWVATPSSRVPFQLRDRTQVSCIAGRFFTAEQPGKPPLMRHPHNHFHLKELPMLFLVSLKGLCFQRHCILVMCKTWHRFVSTAFGHIISCFLPGKKKSCANSKEHKPTSLSANQVFGIWINKKWPVTSKSNKPVELLSLSFIQLCDDISKGTFNPGNDD